MLLSDVVYTYRSRYRSDSLVWTTEQDPATSFSSSTSDVERSREKY